MGLTVIDAMLRGGSISLFLLLTLLFARNAPSSLAARLGVGLAFGGACYVALVALDSVFGFDNPWRLPLHVMSLATPALFWPFAAAWFDDDFEWRWYHATFIVVTVVSGIFSNYLLFVLHYPLSILAFGWRGLSVASIALGLRATLKDWSADLVESRRRVRIALVLGVGISILWIVMAELLTRGWPPPVEWRVMNAASMFLLAAVVSLATVAWRDPELLAPPLRLGKSLPRAEADDSALLTRLDTEMRYERLYRQDALTITAVAARLGVDEGDYDALTPELDHRVVETVRGHLSDEY